jgi:hypothetical protein
MSYNGIQHDNQAPAPGEGDYSAYLCYTVEHEPYWPNGAYEQERRADRWIEQSTGDTEGGDT